MPAEGPVFELRLVLTVEDYDEAMQFYRDALGLPVTREFGEGPTRGGLLAAGKATIEIVGREGADHIDGIEVGRPLGTSLRVAMEVSDSAALGQRLADAGGEKVAGPVTTPWGHQNVRLRSPEGFQLTLFTVVATEPG